MKLSLAMPKAVEEPQDMGGKKQLFAFLAKSSGWDPVYPMQIPPLQ